MQILTLAVQVPFQMRTGKQFNICKVSNVDVCILLPNVKNGPKYF